MNRFQEAIFIYRLTFYRPIGGRRQRPNRLEDGQQETKEEPGKDL